MMEHYHYLKDYAVKNESDPSIPNPGFGNEDFGLTTYWISYISKAYLFILSKASVLFPDT